MIKLIACDLDGTLLTSYNELPQDFQEIFNEMNTQKVLFCACSGRQSASMKALFKNYINDIIFISDNGSYVFEKDKVLFSKFMDVKILNNLLTVCRENKYYPVLVDMEKAYIENLNSEFLHEFKKYFIEFEIVPDLYEIIKSKKILTADICSFNDAPNNSFPTLKKHFEDLLYITISNNRWVNIVDKSVSKGKSINLIQDMFSIGYEETAAFGDFINDINLLKEAKFSYAMKTSPQEVKDICAFEANSNDTLGVIMAIKKLLKENEANNT